MAVQSPNTSVRPPESSVAAPRESRPPDPRQSAPAPSDPTSSPLAGTMGAAVLSAIGLLFAWAYWPTLQETVGKWNNEADYSHGYLVVPLALFFLWARRDRFPGWERSFAWPGLLLIAASVVLRAASAHYYIDSLDAWSIPLWVGGCVWLLAGWRVFWWSLPSVAFLWFMTPLPWRFERVLSVPLQGIASQLSCWMLQFLGQPAIAEGHTIWIDQQKIEIAEACSGLRIFVGVFALAVAYAILVRRSWWERLILLASAVPIALVANAMRIVVTGLLYQHVSADASRHFAHDGSGWAMIPLAAAMFACVVWYVSRLFPEIETITVSEIVRRGPARPKAK
ncbi:MAG: exosortase/archaeosortase family protein [Planctomycetota bacterium]